MTFIVLLLCQMGNISIEKIIKLHSRKIYGKNRQGGANISTLVETPLKENEKIIFFEYSRCYNSFVFFVFICKEEFSCHLQFIP